jgi:hypothetical protein
MAIYKPQTDGLMSSWLAGCTEEKERPADEMPDRRMKQYLESFLVSQGWDPEINWSSNHGIDIEAKRDLQHWIIQVTKAGPPTSPPNNSFIFVLGEILQRMDDPAAKYSVAMPDTRPFYRLWKRLPWQVKNKTGLSALFVDLSGSVRECFEK